MNGLAPVLKVLFSRFPSRLDHLCIGQFVIDTIAAENDEVVIILNLETLNVWSRDDNLWIALVLGSFRLYVTEGSRD